MTGEERRGEERRGEERRRDETRRDETRRDETRREPTLPLVLVPPGVPDPDEADSAQLPGPHPVQAWGGCVKQGV